MSKFFTRFIPLGVISLYALVLTSTLSGNQTKPTALHKPAWTVLSRQSGQMTVQFDFPDLQINGPSEGRLLTMGGTPRLPQQQGYLLPAFALTLPLDFRDLQVQVVDTETERREVDGIPARFEGDQMLQENAPLQSGLTQVGGTFGSWIELIDMGTVRSTSCASLRMYPVRWDARNREVIVLRSLTVQFNYPEKKNGRTLTAAPEVLQSLSGNLPLPASVTAGTPQPPQSNANGDKRLKLYVSETGLYHLGRGYLAARGVNVNSDPRTFRLENRGEEIPIYVYGEADGRFDEEDYIEFWGDYLHGTYSDQNPEIYSDLYTDVNVYWLSWGADLGQRLIEESGEIVEVDPLNMVRPSSYPYTIHAEENEYYNRLSQVGPDSLKEHWYYDSGIEAPQQKNYWIFLPHPDTDALINASITVSMIGMTYTSDPDDEAGYHHAYVYINDMTSPSGALQAGTGNISPWRSQTSVMLQAQGNEGIRASSLFHGNNRLSVFCPGDTRSGTNDKILLNWFELTYQRLYKAADDIIRFAPPENASTQLVDFRIDDFTNPNIDVYKIGQSKIINAEILPYQGSDRTYYELHFQDHPYGNRDYIALTPGMKLIPDSTEIDWGESVLEDLTTGEPVKLLVIANRLFENHADLNDYISRRNAELGRTDLIFIDDVFDEFTYGIYDPGAISDLLQALPVPPEFLLLVGDASYDTRNSLLGLGGNLMPTPYVQTKAYGSVASDFEYSLLDDDLLPDLAVGRISARDAIELRDYLRKLEEYETETESGRWRNVHLYVTGTDGVQGTSFLTVSQNVISRLEDDVFVERLATDPISSPFYGGTTDLIDLLEEGALVVDYNGHGAGAVWSDNSLFRLENLPQLSNQGLYPFVTNFTCFIGAYDNLAPESILGEEFIFAEEKGAIAVLASTGLGWFFNGGWLQEELAGLLYDNPDLRLGQIINAAKISYFNYYGLGGSVESFDTMHLMNLLGDPSLNLAFPQKIAAPASVTPEFVSYGDQVEIRLDGDYGSYQGFLRIYDEFDYPALSFGEPLEYPLIPEQTGIGVSFELPELADTSDITGGSYRLTLWNPATEATKTISAPLYLYDAYQTGSTFDSLSTTPDPVEIDDAFTFRAKILDAQGIESARMIFDIETALGDSIDHDTLVMVPAEQPYWFESEVDIDASMYPYSAGDRFVIEVEATDSEGETSLSDEFIFFIVDWRVDPEWGEGGLSMGVHEGHAALLMEVFNDPGYFEYTAVIDSLDVSFYVQGTDSLEFLGSTVVYDIGPDSTVIATLASPFEMPDLVQMEVRLNSAGWVEEDYPTPPYQGSLLIDHFNIDEGSGLGDTLVIDTLIDTTVIYDPENGTTTIDTSYNDAVVCRVFIPADSITGSGVLRFSQNDALELSLNQNDLSWALQDNYGLLSGFGFDLELLGEVAFSDGSLYLAIESSIYDTASSVNDMSIHHQAVGQSSWQLMTGETQAISSLPGQSDPRYRHVVHTGRTGEFTLLQNGDKVGPALEISVEGQIYTEGGYVARQPKISAVVQDPGGVDLTPGSYWIRVDGDTTEIGEVTSTVTENGQVLNLSYRPNTPFITGDHTFSVYAEDLAGNASAKTINFKVTGEFRLDFLGNYPNPFKDRTLFTYRLTEQTTEPVEVKIYTVSGRLIKTLHSLNPEEINYGEIFWDGRDEDGHLIANGVYFYKFVARRSDEEIERTMKLAKLR